MHEPTQKQTPMASTTTLKIARWRRGDGAFLKKGRMKSCVQHIEMSKMRVSSVETTSRMQSISRRAVSQRGKMLRTATGIICCM